MCHPDDKNTFQLMKEPSMFKNWMKGWKDERKFVAKFMPKCSLYKIGLDK